MIRIGICAALVAVSTPAIGQKTDWGIRVAPQSGEKFLVPPATAYVDPSLRPVTVEVIGGNGGAGTVPANMRAIAAIGPSGRCQSAK